VQKKHLSIFDFSIFGQWHLPQSQTMAIGRFSIKLQLIAFDSGGGSRQFIAINAATFVA